MGRPLPSGRVMLRREVAVLSMAVALASAGAYAQHVSPEPAAALGPLEVSPAAPSLSVVVGDAVRFTAAAQGAHGFTWSLWGRVMSRDPVWEYVPAPEDAGWQQVQLEVRDAHGNRRTYTWEVGVVAAVAPEVVDVSPPPGPVAVGADGTVTLRCAARVPAARAHDRVRFRWELDDHVVRRDVRGEASGSSEVTLSALPPGTYRVVARVTEDGRASSLVEWSLTVAARTPAPVPPPRESPLHRLVARPAPGQVERREGEPITVVVNAEPGATGVVYEWLVDGRRVPGGSTGRFEHRTLRRGRHRLDVRAAIDGARIGDLGWTVVIRPPEIATPPAPPEIRVEAPPAPPALAEQEVRAWVEEYARAWSRKDVGALRRMGQVRTAADADRLERYFGTIEALHVEVRVLALRVEGERAAVELERIDTVTDPTGHRQELRLPPLRKQIERTPEGLQFAEDDGRG